MNEIEKILRLKKRAQLSKRIFAYIVDIAIVNLVIVFPFQNLLQKISIPEGFNGLLNFLKNNVELASTIFYISLIIALLTVLYWTILEYKTRQSVGKILFKLYVNPVNTKKLTFSQCFLRNITKISLLTIALDTFYMLYTKQNQRYFEKISNTEVLEK